MNILNRASSFVAALALGGVLFAGVQDAEARRRPVEVTVSEGTVRTISVQSEGTVRVAPDRATVTMLFNRRAEGLMDAHNGVQRDLQVFVESVIKAGFPRDLVRNGGLRYHPEYAHESGHAPRVVGYNAQMTVVLRIDNIDDVPRVMELAIAAGAAELQPVEYRVSNLEEKQAEARALAMKAVRERAEELAAGFGASIGEVQSISEQQIYNQQPRFARMEMAMDSAGSGDSFAQIDPDAVEVRASISATFLLK